MIVNVFCLAATEANKSYDTVDGLRDRLMRRSDMMIRTHDKYVEFALDRQMSIITANCKFLRKTLRSTTSR